MRNGGSSYHRLVFTSYTPFSPPLGHGGEALGRAGVGWRGCRRRGMLSEGWVYPGEEVVAGTGRWAVCRRAARSELTLSAAGEKGKGARGVPQIKEVWGKKS